VRTVWGLVLVAAGAFFVLFSPWTKATIAFFPMMTLSAFLLAAVSLVLDRKNTGGIDAFKPVYIPVGLIAAAVLYGMFWAGHFVSTHILPFAASQVESIYTLRAGQNPWLIAMLLFFLIGPAEEIFWRGFVQGRLSKKWGVLAGFIISAAIYTLVHVGSFNLMLIAAAGLCGVFWGLLFAVTGNVWPCIISHAVWDVVVFILLPIQ
jgi:membrane protease YdiL (CAAX protease family)